MARVGESNTAPLITSWWAEVPYQLGNETSQGSQITRGFDGYESMLPCCGSALIKARLLLIVCARQPSLFSFAQLACILQVWCVVRQTVRATFAAPQRAGERDMLVDGLPVRDAVIAGR